MQYLNRFKNQILKSPLVTAAIVCFVIALSVFIFGGEKSAQVKGVARVAPTNALSPTEKPKDEIVASPTKIPTPTPTPAQTNNSTQSQSNSQVSTSPTSSQTQQKISANLSINGGLVGSVSVASGVNQCDLLSQALSQGKISSLNMKYDNSLGTYGVYQINGIGKENTVWWVYKINGNSPTQGCSYIKVNEGDSVEWEYKGS